MKLIRRCVNRHCVWLFTVDNQNGACGSFGKRELYSSLVFRQCLADFGIKQSQSWAGKCTNNAVMERFFDSLRTEKLYREYTTKTTAQLDIAEYIKEFYNPKRLHSVLGNLSPMIYL